jgi:lipopolysaccharide biosynthesis regulator YciM
VIRWNRVKENREGFAIFMAGRTEEASGGDAARENARRRVSALSVRAREWEAKLRLYAFQLEETRRQVADIELMIADFSRKREELEMAVKMEERQAGVEDPKDVRYPLAALDMRKRHENLGHSIKDLEKQLEIAIKRVEEAQEELDTAHEQAEREGVEMVAMPSAAAGLHPIS